MRLNRNLSDLRNVVFVAVGPGDTWGAQFDMKQVLGAMGGRLQPKGGSTIPIKYSLKSFEDSGGMKLALIEFTMAGNLEFTGPGGQGSIALATSAKGTAKVDTATGVPFDVTSKSTNDVTVGTIKTNQSIDSTMKQKS